MSNFWQKLPKPFTVLAPMEGVTDHPFRELVAQTAKPDVLFTEFTSADGLVSAGKLETIKRLTYSEAQRPIVAQIWGINPSHIEEAARVVAKLGFDGIDINMGCPVKTVIKRGAGAALCLNPALAGEIIDAAKLGAGGLPVSVKTRIGFNKVITEEWITFLLGKKIAALTVHGRTAKQMSKVPADWAEIGRAVELRDRLAQETIIVGNGDVKSLRQVGVVHKKYGVDGVMIGRGIFANPWVFKKGESHASKNRADYINLLRQHLDLYEEVWGSSKSFAPMKKFFKMYINNFAGASEARSRLMSCGSAQETRGELALILKN